MDIKHVYIVYKIQYGQLKHNYVQRTNGRTLLMHNSRMIDVI